MQYAALAQGYYAKRGLTVELVNTPNSTELRNGLAEGRYHIAHAAIDNAVAQVEIAKVDSVRVHGRQQRQQHAVRRPEINSYDDLRGKTLVVDAPNTAFALLAYKMLQEKGLKKGDYQVRALGAPLARMQAMQNDPNMAVAILNPPQTAVAQKAGLKNLGTGGFGDRSLSVGLRLGAAILGTGQRRHADPLHPGQHRRQPLGVQSGEPAGARQPPGRAAQAAAGHYRGIAEGLARSERLCAGCPPRHQGLREHAQAARRDARHLGRRIRRHLPASTSTSPIISGRWQDFSRG